LGFAIRALGSIAGLFLLGLLGLIAWSLLRLALFDDALAPEDLERKRVALAAMAAARVPAPRPNVIVIFLDDLGLGDLGAFGSEALRTPHIDAFAEQGLALDSFYSASPICTPSRAGLLTGRWPVRSRMDSAVFPEGTWPHRMRRVSGKHSRLPEDEITLPEALKLAGYRTGMVGKWHLGSTSPSLPTDLGFDSYFGMLFSNDMDPVPLWQNDKIVEPHPVDQSTLTERYTAEALRFLKAESPEPFFLYLAHNFPHVPLHASEQQRGHSPAGLYGDVLADLDRSVGALLDTLEQSGLAKETLVVLASDNGPWHQGSPGGARGRKGDVFEGGMHVPFVAHWPGEITAGTRSHVPATAVDLLPTLLALAGVPLPTDRVIDGVDLAPLLFADEELAPRPILYYSGLSLWAVREARFKAHKRRNIPMIAMPGHSFWPAVPKGPWLFQLELDPDDSYDLSLRHPNQLTQMLARMDYWDTESVRNPRGWR
jgi:arylsulfatase A-like enzyme